MAYRERNILEDVRGKLTNLRAGGRLDDAWGLYLLMGLRNFLEQRGQKEQFPYISFYADWMVHPKLDRTLTGRRIVVDIVDVLKNQQITLAEKTVAINRRLGHHTLRGELETFFTQHQLDNLILTDPNWRQVFGQLARLITAKPIDLHGRAEALCRANEIEGVAYDSYPTFWLDAPGGARIDAFVACVPTNQQFSEQLVREIDTNGLIIFQAGLYWDAL